MTSNQPASLTVKFALASLATILLWFATGCGKAPETGIVAPPEVPIAALPESVPETIPAPPPTVVAAVVPSVPEIPEVTEAEVTNYVPDLAAGETLMVEAQIYEITISEHTSRAKAEELLALFPRLEPEAQRKVARAAVRQVGDADYDVLAQQLLNSTMDAQVSSVFVTDLLKRKSAIKLPTLLELARVDGHPLQQTSSEQLKSLLQTDQGKNWDRWERVVEMRLAREPN